MNIRERVAVVLGFSLLAALLVGLFGGESLALAATVFLVSGVGLGGLVAVLAALERMEREHRTRLLSPEWRKRPRPALDEPPLRLVRR